ncbi:hypothetical protein BE04_30190 [Sorangium cellulosum]|uniref:Uncharacterized protein n=1 Tax=Sorangium cellulosum TaxID=56 RepID=A0A150PXG7_SORCE|nr:hypothetical protein BE04_30190 [Sorangium cellulosum]
MLDWLKKRLGSKHQPVHPPWRAGQYVTYFLEREDGTWTAMAIRLHGQMADGSWALSADFKTPLGECTAWFRSDPRAPLDMPDPTPGRVERIRGASMSGNVDVATLVQRPEMQTSMAMNLLLVRRWDAAKEALGGAAREVRYPCGIDRAYPLVTPIPGAEYQKHHDLNPRVMLTGVACLSIDGGKNPITVTSFGWSDPKGSMPDSFDDFVDFSHPKRVDHEGFSLAYPATWFLRSEETEESGLRTAKHFAQLGGNTCAATLSVTLSHGEDAQVAAERDGIVSRVEALPGSKEGEVRRRMADVPVLSGDAAGFAFDLGGPAIDGFSANGVFRAEAGDRVAHVSLFGCVARANPRRDRALADMRAVFRETVESFQFT